MIEFANILVGGLVTGAVYALLAVGFSLVFNTTGVLNLAQGAFVATGALVMYDFRVEAKWPLGLAFLASAVIMTAVMGLVEWLVIRRAVQKISHTNLLMLMGGLLTAFEGVTLLVWGSNPYTLPPFSGSKPFDLGGVFVATQDIWVVAVSAAVVLALWLFLSRTETGAALRAVAEQRSAARLVGISVDRTILLSFCVSALLGVIAGAVIVPLTSLDFSSMASFTNLGLIAVTLGGLGSILGAAAGGVVFGVVQALVSGYVSSLFGTAISLILLVVLLIFRPQGLLGRARGFRVDVAESRAGRVIFPPRLSPTVSRGATMAIVLVMAVLPLVMGHTGDMHAIDITGVFCLTIVGLELLTGVAGQVSLGQAGFMAVGGYTSSVLIVSHHWPPLLALLAGVLASAVVAVVLGVAGTRVRGMYLAIVTLSFGILVQAVAAGLSFTGGPSGLTGIPSFEVGGYSFGTNDRFYYLIWGLVGVSLVLTTNLLRSHRGAMLRAMHADDIGARSLGVNLFRTKIVVFVISAVIASVAGTLYACYFHYLAPDMVGSSTSLELITMLVVGGAGTQAGPLIGVALLTFFPQLSQSLQTYSALVDGLLLVVFLRFLPSGVYGALITSLQWVASRLDRRRWGVGRREQSLPEPVPWLLDAPGSQDTPGAEEVEKGSAGPPDPRQAAGQPARAEAAQSGVTNNWKVAAGSKDSVPALRVEGLDKSFGGLKAVSEVSFEVPRGSISALIGPNGAGKSTVFNLITNLYHPDRGRVELDGRPVGSLPPDSIARMGLFRTFQTSRVFPNLSVLENVLVGACRYASAGYLTQSLWARKARREESELVARARAILEVIGLAEVADRPGHTLPLASQKNLDVARALMSGAHLLLFDEPGAGMNDAETLALGAMLLAVREAGHTILVVDHNMTLVMGIADKVTVLDRGSVIADGPPSAVQSDPAVVDAYFGQAQVV